MNPNVAWRSTDVAGRAAQSLDAKDQQDPRTIQIIPYLARAAAAGAAAVLVALLGGVAQATNPPNQATNPPNQVGDPPNQVGDRPNQVGDPRYEPDPRDEPGTFVATCRSMPAVEDIVLQCTLRRGVPGPGGPTVGY